MLFRSFDFCTGCARHRIPAGFRSDRDESPRVAVCGGARGGKSGRTWLACTDACTLSRRRARCDRHPEGAIGEYAGRSEEHTSELQSLMRISYAVFCLKKTKENSA